MSPNILPPFHLDREFLPIRAKILEIAAALDRIERATEASNEDKIDRHADDPRWDQLQAGIRLLQASEAQRAEQVQLLFSRPYDQQWRQDLGITDG